MKYLFTFLIALVLYGCNFGEKKHAGKTGNISIVRLEDTDTDPQLLTALIDSVTFLPLIEQDNFLFSRINKIIVRDRYIYLMDIRGSNSLLVFDEAGTFVRNIGTRGSGPGEYVKLTDFETDSENIYLYDWQTMRMLKYDLQGNFIEAHKTPFCSRGFKILENGKYLSAIEQENSKYQVIRMDSDFNVEISFLSFPDKYAEFIARSDINNMIHAVDGILSYTRFCNDIVYTFSEEGEFTGGILFDFGSKTVPEKYRNDYELFMEEGGGRFNYFQDTPFKLNQLWIGFAAHQGKSATFVYNTVSDKYYFYDWGDEGIVDILFANSKYLIGYVDFNRYNYLKKKPEINSSAMTVLEEGGHGLLFYHLKQNRDK
jgi:hypothetical protein